VFPHSFVYSESVLLSSGSLFKHRLDQESYRIRDEHSAQIVLCPARQEPFDGIDSRFFADRQVLQIAINVLHPIHKVPFDSLNRVCFIVGAPYFDVVVLQVFQKLSAALFLDMVIYPEQGIDVVLLTNSSILMAKWSVSLRPERIFVSEPSMPCSNSENPN